MINFAKKVLALGAFLIALIIGPAQIEAFLFPVAKEINQEVYLNTRDKVCWVITFDKLRSATPEWFYWKIIHNGNSHFISPVRPETNKNSSSAETTPLGERRSYRNCIERPSFLNGKSFILYGQAFYVIDHKKWYDKLRFWTVPRYIPPVIVEKNVDASRNNTGLGKL